MLDLLRLDRVRRLVVALILGTFLPVAGASMACQVHCVGNDLQLHDTQHHEPIERGHDPGPPDFTNYLDHGGPCHLTVVPAAAGRTAVKLQREAEHEWRAVVPTWHVSLDWPPPEHRPRA